jgi:hypothetical protein
MMATAMANATTITLSISVRTYAWPTNSSKPRYRSTAVTLRGAFLLGEKQVMETCAYRHYGIDLSEPALELAANNLKGMPFEVELDDCDFVEALSKRPEPADAAWCSLSIHHLQTDGKLHLMRAVHDTTSTMLMIYEPTRQDGESRDQYLERFMRVNRPAWAMLTDEERGAGRASRHHV